MEPVIFLLDLDNTLQGDVSPQLREYELLHKVNSKINNNKKIRYNTKDVVQRYAKRTYSSTYEGSVA